MLIFFWFLQTATPTTGKPTTDYSVVAKPTTAYGMPTKPTTPYGALTKPLTAYICNPDLADGIKLSSSVVTLGSLTVHLHGFASAAPPPANAKTTAAYSDVAKPTTAYS